MSETYISTDVETDGPILGPDAIEQGALFCNMLAENRKARSADRQNA